MKRFIIIDTCIWINLAEEPELYPLIEGLKDILDLPDFHIVLPESIRVEFDNNRGKILQRWQKTIKNKINELKEIGWRFPEHKADIMQLQNKLNISINKNIDQVKTNIALIDEIFRRSTAVNISEEMMAESSRRVFYRIPPAKNPTGTSVGDCLLWLTVLELLREGEVWFCTRNMKDFSMSKQDNFPDPSLDQEAFSVNTKGRFNYSIEIEKLINEMLPVKRNLPKYSDYVGPNICHRCGAESLVISSFMGGWLYRCMKCGYTSQPIFGD